MNKICYGCGAKLQSDDPSLIGYIPKNKEEDAVYCQRCFKLMHYGVVSNDQVKTPEEIIKSINNDQKEVIFLVDFLNLNTKVINLFNLIKKPKLLLISKCDLIPNMIKEASIIKFIRDTYNVKSDIKLISVKNGYGIKGLITYLERIKEAYIIGLSNSGKSTLINKILNESNSKKSKLVTSYHSNTTLDFIRVEVNSNLLLIDSPGFIIPSYNYQSKDQDKRMVKPITYQMKDNETIKIDQIDLNFIHQTSITLYLPEVESYKDFKKQTFPNKINVPSNSDLIIIGFGFINIKHGGDVYFDGIDLDLIEVRPSLFGVKNE